LSGLKLAAMLHHEPEGVLDFMKDQELVRLIATGLPMALEQELDTFRRELPQLLLSDETKGKFALIHADELAGTYSTFEEALEAGYELFGLEQFLVKQAVEHEKPRYFSRNLRCHL
jgi:hypothetical protein